MTHARPYDSCTKGRSELDFRILGQLEVRRAKHALRLGSPKQRALLGFLILHANTPVSRDQLIDELWGDAAPATVRAALNVYLSRLRRLLEYGDGEQPLVTEAAGYVLRVPPGQLDAHRFEALLEQGRRQLADGEVEPAAVTLRSALALWRGQALADLAYEPFAQTEIARLEELQLAALEERFEAELALGRHDALAPELEALIAEYPYRERLRAQLMLALYRSGRQVEALEAYRRARRTLVDELGLEPGPRLQELEQAILRQDPSLEPAERSSASAESGADPGRERTQLRTRVIAGVVAVVAIVVVAAVAGAGGKAPSRSPASVRLAGGSVAVVDSGNGAIRGEIPAVGGRPSVVAVAAGSVWFGDRDEKTLARIDPRSRSVVDTIRLGVVPTRVRSGIGSVWVLSDQALFRLDPATNDLVRKIPLPVRGFLRFPWTQLEVAPNGVWVCSCAISSGELARIDPATGEIVFRRRGPIGLIAYSEGVLWALIGAELDTLERIDPHTQAVIEHIPVSRIGETYGGGPRLVATTPGSVWIASERSLWRLDPETHRFTGSVSLGHGVQAVAVGGGALWALAGDGTLLRVDPHSQRVTKTIRLGFYPAPSSSALAVGEGAAWVALTAFAANTLNRA